MRGNTLVMLVIAIVFGAIAVFVANVWLQRQEPRQAVLAPEPAKVEIATIVVAGRDLTFGEPLNDEVLREIPWPRASVPDGAFAKIADVTKDGRRVALTAISPNEPLLKWKISGPGARASLSALVKEGMRAVAVRINDSSGVAGFVLPGDRVDVLYTREGDDKTIDILLQNVRVLAINQIADEKKSEPIAAKVATLELMPTDAQKISLAQTTGSLTLTLRSAGSLDQAPSQRIVENELVSNPSVYQTTFDAQAANQTALEAKLKGLEGGLSQVAKKVDEQTGSAKAELAAKLAEAEANLRDEIANAGAISSAELQSKLKGIESNLSKVAKRVDQETGSTKAELAAKLASIETSLRGQIANAGASSSELKAKLLTLEAAVKQTAKATGQGEVELRKKLAELEKAIRLASSATGQGEEALRAKLAEFEASLRQAMADSNKAIVVPAALTTFVEAAKPATANIKIYRGMKDEMHTVPLDIVQQ